MTLRVFLTFTDYIYRLHLQITFTDYIYRLRLTLQIKSRGSTLQTACFTAYCAVKREATGKHEKTKLSHQHARTHNKGGNKTAR